MSLHFNWSRLDETCAEALRQLVNKRLAEVVERINAKSAGGAAPSPATQGAAFAAGAAGPHPASNSTAAAKGAAGVGHAAPSPLVGFSGGNPMRAEPSSNVSAHGSPREVYSSLLGASEIPSRSPYLAVLAAGSGGGGGGGTGLGGAVGVPPRSPGPSGASTVAAAVASSPHGLSDASALSAPRGDGSGLSRAGLLAAASMNATAGGDFAAGFSSGGGAAGGGGVPSRVGAPVASASPSTYAGPAGAPREGDGAAPRTEPPKVPPIVYLEVGSLEWGTTPPFVEIVAFKNATDGPPGYNRAPQRGSVTLTNTTAGSPLGDGRDMSSYALSHATSAESTMASSTALVGLFPSPTAGGGGVGGDAPGNGVGDNGSESSHDFTVSRSATGVSTPHIATAGLQLGVTGMVGNGSGNTGAGTAAAPPVQTQGSTVSLSQFPSQPEAATDMLASVLGVGGLHIRFHITYGGALHLTLNTAVQHELRLGPVALRVSLPMLFYLANLDLDCYLCINIKNNACQVWVEHGPLSSSVVNRLSITATFGGDEDLDGGGVDYGASSTDFYSRFGSSSISDDDVGEGGSGAYVNEHEVSQFVLHELRAILKETIVAPHCITIPITFSG